MEQQRKRVYETTFIVNATLDDAQIDQINDRLKEFLVKNGAEIIKEEKWGRKRLAYPIQKKNNGFYTVCEFSAGSDISAKLERHYTLDENVMRFLTVQLSEKLLKARKEQELRAAKEETPPVAAGGPTIPPMAPAAPPVAAAPAPAQERPKTPAVPPGSQDDEDDEDDAT